MPSVTVLPLTLPLVEHPQAGVLLYPHQARMLDEWEKHDSFLLVTKTGTGKTIGAILPILKNKQRAICVYPTNELIRDQVRNIKGVAEREGLTVCVQTPDSTAGEYTAADVVLVHIDAAVLQDWCNKKRFNKKWRALRSLLEADKCKIVLTNPDILFLIFALRYHAEPLAQLPGYDALIADEFHLYTGVELAHALYMLHVGRSLGAFRKIVLLSATPHPEVGEILRRVLGNPLLIDSSAATTRPVIGERQAVRQVEIVARLIGSDVVESAVAIVSELSGQIRERRSTKLSGDYVPAVIVVDSVVNAIRLEDRLREEGWLPEEMAIVRGLSSRQAREQARDMTDKLLVIGTSAIEVGIDFQCDYLIFEASEAASFMQRFGRLGRHTAGIAYVLCRSNVLSGIERLQSPVERGELESRVYNWYPSRETRAWFAKSPLGLLSAFTMTENLIQHVRGDHNASDEQVAVVTTRMEEIGESYIQALGCDPKMFTSAVTKLRNARAGAARVRWLTAYRDLNTFRTSLPSEWVLDYAEKDRRGGDWEAAKYSADIATLLRRAEGLRFKESLIHPDGNQGLLAVNGYGRYRRVWIPFTFADDHCGILYTTREFPEIRFIQEGHPTSISHVMTLRDHVFVVVPRELQKDLDWRLPVFECGRHLIAFDGTALVACELYNKWDDKRRQRANCCSAG